MPDDLVVGANAVLTISDDPGPGLDTFVERVPVTRLSDLVSAGLVRESVLTELLKAGKAVTAQALSEVTPARRVPFVPGSRRLDLGRYTAFTAASAKALPSEQSVFWKYFREVEPFAAGKVTIDTEISQTISALIRLWTQDCTIEPGGTLQFTGSQKGFICRNLLIKRTGRIVVRGVGVSIRANSIQGEQ